MSPVEADRLAEPVSELLRPGWLPILS
jgi:hypothetical protein